MDDTPTPAITLPSVVHGPLVPAVLDVGKSACQFPRLAPPSKRTRRVCRVFGGSTMGAVDVADNMFVPSVDHQNCRYPWSVSVNSHDRCPGAPYFAASTTVPGWLTF